MNGPVLGRDAPAFEGLETGDRAEFRSAVLSGLSQRPRAIPPRFLYDQAGSDLFDRICDLPEYYLTRTETEILKRHAADIASRAGPGCALIEYGSGSSVKSRLLLDALKNLTLYSPIDISRQHLDHTAARLRRDYPRLHVEPVCADYMTLEALPPLESGSVRDAHPVTTGDSRRLGFFPGSTIGNLEPHDATAFLKRARRMLGPKGALILGADLKKDHHVLHAAYNDSAGVTAGFTLNLLRRMNRELEANFDLAGFAHDAFYNPDAGRIEIYVRSLRRQTVTVAGQRFDFDDGERVHAEYSYKYDLVGLDALAESGGFRVDQVWMDPEKKFAVAWLA